MAQSIGAILQQLADFGIFFYVLPFLLVFALVFAILQKVKITGEGNKGIDAVIALTVSLMSLQFDAVPIFFQIIFPKVGIALSILLAAMLLLGLTLDIRKRQGKDEYNISIMGFIRVLINKGFEVDEHLLNVYLDTEEMKNLKEEINRLKLK